MTVLGLMSGTSFDGLDLCCVSFEKVGAYYQYTLHDAYTQSYHPTLVSQLQHAHLMNESELQVLERAFDDVVLQAVTHFRSRLSKGIDLLSSHGHTVFHQPEKGITRQIGDGRRYFETLQIPVVYDFRTYDVALGGQGAPLVPIGDALLFSDYDACVNLGGISNISYEIDQRRVAYDIGMFNTPINDLVQPLGYAYDEDGRIGASGQVIPELLSQLNALEYFGRNAPKSLGKEWYHHSFYPLISEASGSIPDKVTTVTTHNVIQIATVLNQRSTEKKNANIRVLVTGGGAHNLFALKKLGALVNENIELSVPEKQLIDYKEALIFGFMGYLRSRNEINVYSSVTGASKDSCAGTYLNH